MEIIPKIGKMMSIFNAEILNSTLWELMLNLILAGLIAFIIAKFYVKFGRSLSNRRSFSLNFVLLAMTTTLIITIVRSSLALSLGLVGALSIVRFRAAIKEPEELAYLFFVIAIGLGLGANQRLLTIIAVGVILSVIKFKIRREETSKSVEQNVFLNIVTSQPTCLTLTQIRAIVEKYCPMHRLKRVDHAENFLEVSLLVEFKDQTNLPMIETELNALDPAVKITMLDSRGGAIAIP